MFRTVIRAWTPFAKRLAELDAALTEVERMAPEHEAPGVEADKPKFINPARNLLEGRPLAISVILARLNEVDQTTTVAEAWPTHARQIAELRKRARQLGAATADLPVNHSDHGVLEGAQRELSEALDKLWTSETAQQLATRHVAGDLEEAQDALASLAHRLPEIELVPLGPGAAAEPSLTAPSARSELAAVLGGKSPTELARTIARRRFRRNVVVLAFLAGVAVWTGLMALYFDKPFGSPRDYVAAFVWGFGAQAILEGLATGLGRVVVAASPRRVAA